MTRVFVTGGSGFIGAHCILQLLKAGYRVRTTVRSSKREADVRAMLKAGGARQSVVNGRELVDLVFHASIGDATRSAERASARKLA